MSYKQSIENCLAAVIGTGGLDEPQLAAALKKARDGLAQLRAWRESGFLPLLALPGRRDDLAALEPVIGRYRDGFDDLLVLGTGGSSLGGRALCALAPPGDGPRIHFLENTDPWSFPAAFERLNLERTGVIAISKSGGTSETMMQFAATLARYRAALGEAGMGHRITVITEPANNPMRRLAGQFGLFCLDHDPGIGGRFSALSLVGLLPAAIAGVDIGAVRDGAAQVLEATLAAHDPGDCAPALGAAVSVALAREHGVSATVFMAYADALRDTALWFRQLWAESLGKQGRGTTPIDAVGTVDQHSQLQLWLDGPADKMFTIVTAPSLGQGDRTEPAMLSGIPELDWLAGRTLGDLLDAHARGTADALAAAGRPVRTLRLDAVDEQSLGALLMHFMLETIIAAHMMGVNPFDQPAVEEGKVRARAYMDETR
ncbi:MAG: glucose-6-phosphate isomerase [Alphaproteobacteria bacterium]|nr:glucose-6-phosphate isomerase [Alphaproteobacteria bacterium]